MFCGLKGKEARVCVASHGSNYANRTGRGKTVSAPMEFETITVEQKRSEEVEHLIAEANGFIRGSHARVLAACPVAGTVSVGPCPADSCVSLRGVGFPTGVLRGHPEILSQQELSWHC